MPNHITNVIEAHSEVLVDLLHRYTQEERDLAQKVFDQEAADYRALTGKDFYRTFNSPDVGAELVTFEKLIPPPDHPDYRSGGCSHAHVSMFNPGVEEHPNCWYVWNTANWGTKWGPYDQEVQPGIVRFDTAWSHPFPVIQALSRKNPSAEIHVQYADEDLGSNCGEYWMVDGSITQQTELETRDDEAADFAARVKYGKSYAEMKKEWGE